MALSLYLDTSVIVALFVADPFAARADKFLRSRKTQVIVSDFGSAELASAMARLVRMSNLTRKEAQSAFADFDVWIAGSVTRIEATSSDIRVAESFLRRLDLTLRTPDAVHIAIARRLGAELVTFDTAMAACARNLGVTVARA
ncbi:MAG TPA: type II toxin-antitoxin system VapC family toxin [Rhizomicrobium sp.]